MRVHRRTALGATLTALLGVSGLSMQLAAPAAAAPHHDRGLTIVATPDPITAGEGVLIYGQLHGHHVADQRIWLFHRINPAARFTPVSVTRTNASGFYEFVRADGVVVSNRNWFVLGPRYAHSRTIHELVSSVVTLSADQSAATTAQPVSFTGTVFPAHPHQHVLLQEQNGTQGDTWQTIAAGYTDGHSGFSISHRFRAAGSYTLRAYFPGDPRNLAGQSSSVNLTIQQQQNPSFTINGSAPVVTDGQAETISGTLYAAGSTTSAQANVPVVLYGKQAGGGFQALASTVTSPSGAYTFTQLPLHNTVYRVQTTGASPETSAHLYVGVQDVVTAAISAPSDAVGDAVTVSGTVTPDHSGHVIYLQEQDSTGTWVDIDSSRLNAGSTFSFRYTPGETGNVQLRVQITGGPINIGGVSSPLALSVSGAAPASSLPPAS